MEKLTNYYPIDNFKNSIEYLDNDSVFCDIETLGFSATYQPIYMIGLAFLVSDKIEVTLLFAETIEEESNCIKTALDIISNFHRIITFNGEAFDIPYIKKRAAKYGIETNILVNIESLDLLKFIRQYKKILRLDKCNQKSIEKLLNIEREDKFSGGELIDVYKEFINDNDRQKKELLITHNFDDVCGMVKLLPILSYSSLKEPSFSIDEVSSDDDDDYLILKGKIATTLPSSIRLTDDNYYIIIENNQIRAAIRKYSGILKYYFPYPAKYIYLINEGTVIPKVLATTIDPNNKRPAKAEECFVETDGLFIVSDIKTIKKNPSLFSEKKLFHKDYSEKVGYIKTDAQVSNEWLSDLVRLYIKSYF